MLNAAQIQQFKIDGYLLLKNALSTDHLAALKQSAKQHLAQRIPPFELETEVQYPGAPKTIDDRGGDTIRRLLDAYQRAALFAELAQTPMISNSIQQILQCKELWLNPNHHNCIMTKQPQFSSETAWHRDTRYWHFTDKYLVNAWLAIGEEQQANGAMKILPGSHRWEIDAEALDESQFLKPDHPFNQERLATARVVELNAGDILLFSAHCFHAAGRNTTPNIKYSIVFTYHGESTQPVANTKSASKAEIQIL